MKTEQAILADEEAAVQAREYKSTRQAHLWEGHHTGKDDWTTGEHGDYQDLRSEKVNHSTLGEASYACDFITQVIENKEK